MFFTQSQSDESVIQCLCEVRLVSIGVICSRDAGGHVPTTFFVMTSFVTTTF